jgi:hypothetical protein
MMDDLKARRARGHQVLREMFGEQWQGAYEAGIAGTGFCVTALACGLSVICAARSNATRIRAWTGWPRLPGA